MKIIRARWTAYRVPFRTPYVTARGIASHREGLILQLEDDSGRVGAGEAALLPDIPDGAATLTSLASQFSWRGALDPASIALAMETALEVDDPLSAIVAAFDVALCDLRAQEAGQPIARFLDPGAGSAVDLNALIVASSATDAAEAATRASLAGFRTVKLKVGMAANAQEESRRIAAVCDTLGPGRHLRLDANGAWSVDGAIETLHALAGHDIEYIEQPVPPYNLDDLCRVQDAVAILIAADEDASGYQSALRVLAAGAARVIVLKPAQLGGLLVSWALKERAAAAGIGCVVTTSIGSGIGTAAALHLAAAIGGPYAHGLATLDLLEDDLIDDPGLSIESGSMRLPDGPGLGVQVDEDALDRYAIGRWEVRA
jgi:o-succinylbenzoate synthase